MRLEQFGTFEDISTPAELGDHPSACVESSGRKGLSLPPTCTRAACRHACMPLDHIAMVLSLSRRGTILEANEKFYEISGYRPSDVLGSDFRELLIEADSASVLREFAASFRRGKPWRGHARIAGKIRSPLWADMTVMAQYDLFGAVSGFTLLGLDITEPKEAADLVVEERRRREEMESLLKDIVDTVPNGIVAYDGSGKVIFFNDAHKRIYGKLVPGMTIGQNRAQLVDRRNEQFLLSPRARRRKSASATAKACCRSFVQKLPGDHWVQVQNQRSNAGRLISVQTDVTTLKRAEQHIRHQATRDPLTGLRNRTELFNRLTRAVNPNRDQPPFALLIIDLDDFKGINDTYGHDAGDAYLQQFAHNLKSALRRTDISARLGGDEFAVLLPGVVDAEQLLPILEKLKVAIGKPVPVGNRTLIPCASIGVACFPQDATEPKELLKCADQALYHCKQNSRGDFSLYDTSMRRQLVRRAFLSEELRLTLERYQIDVVLQPQRDMSNGRHFGFEALVRWNVMGEQVSPVELISIAEEAGLVTRLGYQIIERALEIVARLKQLGLEPGLIAFNTVATQLYDPTFPEMLLKILGRHGISPREVELEVTENVILDRSAEVIAQAIQKLHSMGFGIALDDFGTGYASLTHLKRFPLDRLKIDRSFVSGIERSAKAGHLAKDDFIISRTIVSLAHNLRLKVVAEGIETRRQYEELSNIGCDVAQGYLIGRPMIEEDVIKYMKSSGISYCI